MSSSAGQSVADRRKSGRDLRKQVPRSSHGEWSPPADRPDPVELLSDQDDSRLPWLVPIRNGRMSESSFAFYRGGANIMAADLANTPVTGLVAQLCGDAHLSNFGAFGSPDRELVFDVNDFDETLTGPWEWDLKRLATSIVIASRQNGFHDSDGKKATRRTVQTYREAMATFATMPYREVWYSVIRANDILAVMESSKNKRTKKRIRKFEKRARSRDNLRELSKLAHVVDGAYRIVDDPPFIVPFDSLPDSVKPDDLNDLVRESFATYCTSLPDNLQLLLQRYRPVDIALKVVGVGSVGTRCFIVLLVGLDNSDPLFLQIKEASNSVLAAQLSSSPYENQGQRVVEGQRLMQAESDIFLGWSESVRGRYYYWRQLKNMKGSVDVEKLSPQGLEGYGRLCGWTLARAHARSGDPTRIAGYLGSGTVFDHAIGEFAARYADQNERDYASFKASIKSGNIPYAPGYQTSN